MYTEKSFLARLYKAGKQFPQKLSYVAIAVVGLFLVSFLFFLPTLAAVASIMGLLLCLTVDALFILFALLTIGMGAVRFGVYYYLTFTNH